MPSLGAGGGLAAGFTEGFNTVDSYYYRQGLLDLENKRIQQQEKNQKRVEYFKLRQEAIDHLGDHINQLKIAHPELKDIQIMNDAGVIGLRDRLSEFDKNLGLDPNDSHSIVADFASRPSAAVTEKAMAAAKEPPGQAELRSAQASYFRGQAKLFGGDDNTGQPGSNNSPMLQNPDKPGLPANGPALGDNAGGSEITEGTKYISSPFTPRQKAIVFQSGSTPEQFDFDSVMYAYGNTNVTTGYRSYRGINPVTVMRSRAAQYWMDRGLSPQDANATMVEFQAMKHGAQTAATIDARMTQALSKAENTAAILTESGKNGKSLIDNVDRSQYKDLNDFLVNWRGRTGNQPEIRLAIALETLASNYGTALGMGNSVLSDFQTQRAQAMLQRGWATGQLKAAVDQIQQEMTREEAGTRQGMKRFIGGMQNTMDGEKSETKIPPPPSGFNVLGQ